MDWYLKVLKNYAVFEGRASRTEYWFFILFNIIISIILLVIENSLGIATSAADSFSFGVISIIYAWAVLIPSIAVSIRRLHDSDLRGWWMLLIFIPIGNFVLLIFFLSRSTDGKNRYGASPL